MSELNLSETLRLKDASESELGLDEFVSELPMSSEDAHFIQGECFLKPRCSDRMHSVVHNSLTERELIPRQLAKRPLKDEDFSLDVAVPLKRVRTDEGIHRFLCSRDDSKKSELLLDFLPVPVMDPDGLLCAEDEKDVSPLGYINQVDGASDDFDQTLAKDTLPVDNGLALSILPSSDPQSQRPTMPLFRQFGNAYGQAFQSGVVNTFIPGMYGMMPRNSYAPRFPGNIAGSSRFHATQSPAVGPNELYSPQGNVLGFSDTMSVTLPSHQIHLPRGYPAQKHLNVMRWNFSENQNFSNSSVGPSYSRPMFWPARPTGTVPESVNHCSWTPYAAEQQQQQYHLPLRAAPSGLHSPGRSLSANTNQFAHSISDQPGQDICNDIPLLPKNVSRPQSRKTPVGSSPGERLPNEVSTSGDLPKNTFQQCTSSVSDSDSKSASASTSSHFESSRTSSSHPSEAVSSRDSTVIPSLDGVPPQNRLSMAAPLISLSSMMTNSDGVTFPVLSTFPRISTPPAARYGGFENKVHPSSDAKDPFYPVWPSQQQRMPPVALYHSERNLQPSSGYLPVLRPRKPFWYPQLGGNCVPPPPPPQYPPSPAPRSVVLTDLLQQHNMMQRHVWTSEQQSQCGSSSFHSVEPKNELTMTEPLKSSSADKDVSRFAASSSAVSVSCGIVTMTSSTAEISSKMSVSSLESSAVISNCRLDAVVSCKTDGKKTPVLSESETKDQLSIPVSTAGSTDVAVSMFGVTEAPAPSVASESGLISKQESSSATNEATEKRRSSSELKSPLEFGKVPSSKLLGSSMPSGGSAAENITSQNLSFSEAKTSIADGYIPSAQNSVSSITHLMRNIDRHAGVTDMQHMPDLKAHRLTTSPCQLGGANASVPQDGRNAGAVNSQSYELWLMQRDSSLAKEIRNLELQVAQRRRTKKSLMAKQRTAQKSGLELSDDDIRRLSETGDEQTRLQQQLYQCRKDARSHQSKVQEFRLKTMGHDIAEQSSLAVDCEEKPLERMQQFIYSAYAGGAAKPNFAASNHFGGMQRSPSHRVESHLSSGVEDCNFGRLGRNGGTDWKQRPKNDFEVYGKVSIDSDRNFLHLHNGAQNSQRDHQLLMKSDACNTKFKEAERRLPPEHFKETGQFGYMENVNLPSKMYDVNVSPGANRNCLTVDVNQLPGLPMADKPNYESKQSLGSALSSVKKPLKRLFSDGSKVPRKRMKRLSFDYLSQDELMLHPDYEVELKRLFDRLQRYGPLRLTEPDVPIMKMATLLESVEDVVGGYGRLVLHDPDPYGGFGELRHCGEMNKLITEPKGSDQASTMLSLPNKTSHSDNQVSVTVTLSRSAASNVANIVSAIADMLKVAVPVKFEVNPDSSMPVSGKYDWPVARKSSLYEEHAVNLRSLVRARTKFCCHCSLPVEAAKVKIEDEKGAVDEDDRDMFFCSVHCSVEFNRLSDQHGKGLQQKTEKQLVSDPKTLSAGSASHCGVTVSPFNVKKDAASVEHQKLSKGLGTQTDCTPVAKEKPATVKPRKWENTSYKRWSVSLLKSREKQKSITADQQNQNDNLCGIIGSNGISDLRTCAFCLEASDFDTDGAGRLLNMDFGLWVHVNCALWSSEVYETMDGTLMNVAAAYNRGQTLNCVFCGQKGATISCYRTRCTNCYHLECARKDGVTFLENKTCYCRFHYPKTLPAMMLKSLSVCRKVVVDRDENRQVANMLRLDDIENCRLRIGSLIVDSIGQLLPHQIQSGNFNTKDHIYPVGFKSTRYYWSYRRIHTRCRYICKIMEVDGRPNFVIKVKEPGTDDVVFTDSSCSGVWFKILKPFEQIRHSEVLTSFFTHYVCGEDLFGLTEPAIQRVIESLPGVELLTKFKFRFGKSSLYVFPLAINPTGCIRSEPKMKTLIKRSHTLLSSFKVHSSSNGSALLGSGEFNIQQYMKQFTHTKPQRYRSLRTEWRNNVYLRRSNIQGLGLFAARQLEQYTMVIEYIGQLIRNELCEIREKIYEQQNRGIYMFRIDENAVIDATMAGGPARYINHSCDPNCFTEIIPTERGNKIVITALRKINSGEELTYDYKFDLEDDKKIPCLCGAVKCQKWMN